MKFVSNFVLNISDIENESDKSENVSSRERETCTERASKRPRRTPRSDCVLGGLAGSVVMPSIASNATAPVATAVVEATASNTQHSSTQESQYTAEKNATNVKTPTNKVPILTRDLPHWCL